MADLNERLRGIDRVSMPDLWEHARGLAEGGQTRHAPRPRVRRLLTVVVALVIAGAGFAALVLAFHGNGRTPLAMGARPNGVIATLERGAAGELGVENIDLVAIDPATSARVDLTPGPQAESSPVWSPDGTRVAFLRTMTSSSGSHVSIQKGLFAMNADGSNLREVYPCTDPAQCDVREFAWSPDDRYLAFTLERDHSAGGSVIQILDVTTGHITEVCAHFACGQSLVQPAWSPDSTRLAFTDAAVLAGPGGPPASSVWLVEPDGSHLTRLTPGGLCYRQQGIPSCFADTWPSWSPDGSTLAFLHEQTGGLQSSGAISLIQMAPDGSNRRESLLCGTGGTCAPSAPRWSPDGASILFGTGYDQTAQIHLLDPATGAVMQVQAQANPDCLAPTLPSWSPDGQQIAFIGGSGRAANLCVLGRQGGTPQVLIRHLSGYDLMYGSGFTWLPAGAIDMSSSTPSMTSAPKPGGTPLPLGTIVFASSNGSNQEDGGVEIWSMASDGSRVQRLTAGAAATSPSISPDGTKIAFVRSGDVWGMDVDGSGAHQLSDVGGYAGSPVWSADGTQIAFRLSRGRNKAPDGIYVMGANGSDPHLLVRGNTFAQTWQPDGRSITYSAQTPSGGGLHLRTVDLATGLVHPFLDLPGDQDNPVWSPDGSTLAFAWTTAAGSGLYLVNADGSNLRREVGAPFSAGDSGLGIGWSPDGKWLTFEGIDDQHGPQIYAIRADGTGLRRLSNQRGFIAGTSIHGITGNPSWGP